MKTLFLATLLLTTSLYAIHIDLGKMFVEDKCPNATYGFDMCENISNRKKPTAPIPINIYGSYEETHWDDWEAVENYVKDCECWIKKDKNKRHTDYYNKIKNDLEKYKKTIAKINEIGKKIGTELLDLCEELEYRGELLDSSYSNKISSCVESNKTRPGYAEGGSGGLDGMLGGMMGGGTGGAKSKKPPNCKEYMQIVGEYLQKCNEYSKIDDSKSKVFAELAKMMEKIKQDSIKKANLAAELHAAKKGSSDEIKALIDGNAKADLVLDKCRKHAEEFKEQLGMCKSFSNSVNRQKVIDDITKLLKANKLEECVELCSEQGESEEDKKISDLCQKQLVDKVKKLPIAKVNSTLAKIYFQPFYGLEVIWNNERIPKNSIIYFIGEVLQNDGKRAFFEDFMLKHNGQCLLRERWPVSGYAKYLGEETYTTTMGARRTLPSFQLIWCEKNWEAEEEKQEKEKGMTKEDFKKEIERAMKDANVKQIANQLGGDGGSGTQTKSSVKAPSEKDIDMGSSDGSRSKAEILAVVNGRMPGLRNIYNKYLKLKPGFSGKVVLKFTIEPGGGITSIDIVTSTTGYGEFDDAIKNQVSTWRWQAKKSGNTTPTIKFNFEE